MANKYLVLNKNTHCILLYQMGPNNLETRSFSEFENVSDCVKGVINIFEEYLKAVYPAKEKIEYNLSSILHFVDTVHDLSCLVYNPQMNMYAPYNKAWIKEKIYNRMYKDEAQFQEYLDT